MVGAGLGATAFEGPVAAHGKVEGPATSATADADRTLVGMGAVLVDKCLEVGGKDAMFADEASPLIATSPQVRGYARPLPLSLAWFAPPAREGSGPVDGSSWLMVGGTALVVVDGSWVDTGTPLVVDPLCPAEVLHKVRSRVEDAGLGTSMSAASEFLFFFLCVLRCLDFPLLVPGFTFSGEL